jgi:hypothetical protein
MVNVWSCCFVVFFIFIISESLMRGSVWISNLSVAWILSKPLLGV